MSAARPSKKILKLGDLESRDLTDSKKVLSRTEQDFDKLLKQKKSHTLVARAIVEFLSENKFIDAIKFVRASLYNDHPPRMVNESLGKLFNAIKRSSPEDIPGDITDYLFLLYKQLTEKENNFAIDCANLLVLFNMKDPKYYKLRCLTWNGIKIKLNQAFKTHIENKNLVNLLHYLESSSVWKKAIDEIPHGLISGETINDLLETINNYSVDTKEAREAGRVPKIKVSDLFDRIHEIISVDTINHHTLTAADTKQIESPFRYLMVAEQNIKKLREGSLTKEDALNRYKMAITNMPDNLDLYLGLFETAKQPDDFKLLQLNESDKEVFTKSFNCMRGIFKPKVLYVDIGIDVLFAGVQKLIVGQFKEALEDFKKAQELLPRDPFSHSLAGIAYQLLNDTASAKQEVMEALQSVDSHTGYFTGYYLICSLSCGEEINKNSLFLFHYFSAAAAHKNFFNVEKLNREMTRIDDFLTEDRKKGSPIAIEASCDLLRKANENFHGNRIKAIGMLSRARFLCPVHFDVRVLRAEYCLAEMKNPSLQRPWMNFLAEMTEDLNDADGLIESGLKSEPNNLILLDFKRRSLLVRLEILPDRNDLNKILTMLSLNQERLDAVQKKETAPALADHKTEAPKPTQKQLRKQKIEAMLAESEREKAQKQAEEKARKKAEAEARRKAEATAAAKQQREIEAKAEQTRIDEANRKAADARREEEKSTSKKAKRAARLQRSMAKKEDEEVIKEISKRMGAVSHAFVEGQKNMTQQILAICEKEQEEFRLDEIERKKISDESGKAHKRICEGAANMTAEIMKICAKEADIAKRQEELDLKIQKQLALNQAKRDAALAQTANADVKIAPVKMHIEPTVVRTLQSIPKQLTAYAKFLLALQKKTGHRFFLTGGGAFTLARHDLLKEKDSKLNDDELEFDDYDTSTTADLALLQSTLVNKANFEEVVKPVREINPAECKAVTQETHTIALQAQSKLKNAKYPEREFSVLALLPKSEQHKKPSIHISFCHNPKILTEGITQDGMLRDLTINALYWEFVETTAGSIMAYLTDGTGRGLKHAAQTPVAAEFAANYRTYIESSLLEDPIQIIRMFYKVAKVDAVASIFNCELILNLIRKTPDIFKTKIKIKELQSWVKKISQEFFPQTEKMVKGVPLKLIRFKQYQRFHRKLNEVGIMRALPIEISTQLGVDKVILNTGYLRKKHPPVTLSPRPAQANSPVLLAGNGIFTPSRSPTNSPATVGSSPTNSPESAAASPVQNGVSLVLRQ